MDLFSRNEAQVHKSLKISWMKWKILKEWLLFKRNSEKMQVSENISIAAVERNIVKSNFYNQINNKCLIRYNKTDLKGQQFVCTY